MGKGPKNKLFSNRLQKILVMFVFIKIFLNYNSSSWSTLGMGGIVPVIILSLIRLFDEMVRYYLTFDKSTHNSLSLSLSPAHGGKVPSSLLLSIHLKVCLILNQKYFVIILHFFNSIYIEHHRNCPSNIIIMESSI